MRRMTAADVAARKVGDEPEVWPHRELLLQRQQQLLLRSAELRGELAAELRAGWRSVETPIDLLLRLRNVVVELRRRGRDLRERHPWLAASLVFWPPLLRRVWRLLHRRKPAADEARSGQDAGPGKAGKLALLIQAIRWSRRVMRLVRYFSASAAKP
jgi:hypothetical protein